MDKVALVVIENPLLDITVQDPDNVIHDKYKLQHGQASLVDEHTMPIHDEIFAMPQRELTCGGAALNSARAANHMLRKANASGDVAFVGCIGKEDESGKVISKQLEDVKMIGAFAHSDDTATGRCAVIVHGKERTLCANIGASQKYPTSHFDENKALFEKAEIVYSTGFFITSNDEALTKVHNFAVEHNKPMAFNLAAVFLFFVAKDSVLRCIEHSDYVFCNEDEASQYAKCFDLPEKDYVAIAKHIAMSKKANKKRPRVAIVTQGAEPVTVAISHNEAEATID